MECTSRCRREGVRSTDLLSTPNGSMWSSICASFMSAPRLVRARPLCTGRRGKGLPGQAAPLRFSGLRFAATALRCSVSWPVAQLASLTLFAPLRQPATSQLTERAARAGHKPCAARRLTGAAQPARACLCRSVRAFDRREETLPSRQVASGGGDLWGDEERRAEVGARSALRELTRGGCLNAANAVSEVSWPRDLGPSTAVQSERSEDRSTMSHHRVPPAATRTPRKEVPDRHRQINSHPSYRAASPASPRPRSAATPQPICRARR
jgi:hypothetical protein